MTGRLHFLLEIPGLLLVLVEGLALLSGLVAHEARPLLILVVFDHVHDPLVIILELVGSHELLCLLSGLVAVLESELNHLLLGLDPVNL